MHAPGLISTPAMMEWAYTHRWIKWKEVPRLLPPAPIDVANMCRFLASEASDMITGEIIPIELGIHQNDFGLKLL